jgi:hypothetical protein
LYLRRDVLTVTTASDAWFEPRRRPRHEILLKAAAVE